MVATCHHTGNADSTKKIASITANVEGLNFEVRSRPHACQGPAPPSALLHLPAKWRNTSFRLPQEMQARLAKHLQQQVMEIARAVHSSVGGPELPTSPLTGLLLYRLNLSACWAE